MKLICQFKVWYYKAKLNSDNPLKKGDALYRLSLLDCEEALGLLISLEPNYYDSMSYIVRFILRTKNEREIKYLKDYVNKKFDFDYAYQRVTALYGLCKLGEKDRYGEEILKYISKDRRLWQAHNRAIQAIGWLKERSAEEVIITIVNDKSQGHDTLKYAVDALGEIGSEKSFITLKKIIDESAPRIYDNNRMTHFSSVYEIKNLANALYKIDPEKAVQCYANDLTDKNPDIRYHAITVLALMGVIKEVTNSIKYIAQHDQSRHVAEQAKMRLKQSKKTNIRKDTEASYRNRRLRPD